MAEFVELHSAFDKIEEEFQRALDISLDPKGPESLYELVRSLELAVGSRVVDIGCGRGEQAIELAERFGFDVLGIDPVARYNQRAAQQVSRGRVAFQLGVAEAIPVEAESVDLIFCRESLMYTDLDKAVREFARVLRSAGSGLINLVLTGPLMSDGEAAAYDALSHSRGMRPADVDRALREAGLVVRQRVDFQGEWAERRQEQSGDSGRRLLHASRLLRQPDRYIGQFGQDNYEIMLSDCFWHVYRMIGKLTGYAWTFTKG